MQTNEQQKWYNWLRNCIRVQITQTNIKNTTAINYKILCQNAANTRFGGDKVVEWIKQQSYQLKEE